MPASVEILRADQLDAVRACVLLIDVQEKLVPLIHDHHRTVDSCCKLLAAAELFELPVLATEQYPKGLGPSVAAVQAALRQCRCEVLEKPTFSGWAHRPVREALMALDRPQVLVMGIETHVCVQQTALDLVTRDYDVFVCADAAGSRGRLDHAASLDRMRQAGVVVTTTESAMFELCGRCDTAQFKLMLEIVKRHAPME